jgi:hypothetical protein
MHIGLRSSIVAVLLMLAAACSGSGGTAPSGTTQPSVVAVPPPTPTFPPLSGPSRTFVFDHAQANRVRDYTTQSRFVLYDDGAFVLQFPTIAGDGYRGGYTEANGAVTFEWEGWNIAGPWGATGTLNGNSMTVQYDLIMQLSDFEDAVYMLAP